MEFPTYSARVAAEVRAEMGRQRKRASELAPLLQVTQSTLSRRLTGEVAFDLEQIFEVATWLDVSVSSLIGPADPKADVA